MIAYADDSTFNGEWNYGKRHGYGEHKSNNIINQQMELSTKVNGTKMSNMEKENFICQMEESFILLGKMTECTVKLTSSSLVAKKPTPSFIKEWKLKPQNKTLTASIYRG